MKRVLCSLLVAALPFGSDYTADVAAVVEHLDCVAVGALPPG